MALQLDNIPSATRMELITVGRKWGSQDTLDQAQQTLSALDTHAAKLVDHGFGSEELQELKDCADALIAAGVGRETKVLDKKTTNKSHADATRAAQHARLRTRSVLTNARRILSRKPGEPAAAAVRSIDTVLAQTSLTGETTEKIASQLDQLGGVLADVEVVAVTVSSGGPKAVTDTATQAVALRAASQAAAHPRGTPEETETLNLIDGLIVGLVRQARDSAETASKELGEPSLLAAFELTKLYPPTRTKKAPDAAEPPTAPAAAPAPDGAPEKKPAAP